VLNSTSSFFSGPEYFITLPIIMLAVFGIAVLIFDLFLSKEQKWFNAIVALVGLAFSAWSVLKINMSFQFSDAHGQSLAGISGYSNSLLVDRFALYFFYLFLAGAAVAIVISVKYLEIEREDHGEFTR
jgi:NADH-quinone oxidoreductase subunit N